jgi:hypothetical protein
VVVESMTLDINWAVLHKQHTENINCRRKQKKMTAKNTKKNREKK